MEDKKQEWCFGTEGCPISNLEIEDLLSVSTPTLASSLLRKKTTRACIACRKSHVQCDDSRPCKRCTRRGIDCVDCAPKCATCPVVIKPLVNIVDGIVNLDVNSNSMWDNTGFPIQHQDVFPLNFQNTFPIDPSQMALPYIPPFVTDVLKDKLKSVPNVNYKMQLLETIANGYPELNDLIAVIKEGVLF